MNIFPDKFYEPSEEETGLKELEAKIKEKKEKRQYISEYMQLKISTVKFIPPNIDDES